MVAADGELYSTESQIQTQIMALLNENHTTCYGAIRSSWATFPT